MMRAQRVSIGFRHGILQSGSVSACSDQKADVFIKALAASKLILARSIVGVRIRIGEMGGHKDNENQHV